MQRIIWMTLPGMEPFAGGQHHAMQLALQDAGYDVQVQYYQPRVSSLKTDRCDWLVWSFVPSQVDVWGAKLYASKQIAVVHELDPRQKHFPAVDHWCVPSKALRLQLRQADIGSEQVSLISGYAPLPVTHELNLREKLAVDDDTLLLYSGGPLTVATGNRLSIWVLVLLEQIEAPVKLIVHGTGPDHERIEQWMQALHSRDAVYVAPATASVHDLVRQSDIVWLPRVMDGVPDALWAALSLNKPIMTSMQPSHLELIRDGETGLIMGDNHPPAWASAISRMLQDRSIMQRMSQASRTLPPLRMQLPSLFPQEKVAMVA